jgi:DNA topoisomerase-6 subunit B
MQSIAEQMAAKRKEISVSEFFERNKQILGFDTLPRSILTCVKEAVDNSLDACEEASIHPDILVEISLLDGKDTYKICVEDNGPGIVKEQIGPVFAKLLYGSRFHAIRQARGQQGIGVSACVLYAQLTTGTPVRVITKVTEKEYANVMEITIDTRNNSPCIVKDDVMFWQDKKCGTRVEITIRGKYIKTKQSAYEYLKQTAIVNPHSRMTLVEPDGARTTFEHATEEMPKLTVEIKPHPYGLEIGTIDRMAKDTKSRTLLAFLSNDFSRVSYRVAREVCVAAGLSEELRVRDLTMEQKKAVVEAFQKVKVMAPDPECLSPIGPTLIRKGLKNVLDAFKPDVYLQPETRDPKVYAGNPFQVEVGMVYGGNLPGEEQIQILRFANRVPLLYEQGSCVMTAAVEEVDWRRYGLEQRGGKGIPVGPAVVLIHIASTKLPFTSEAKVAVSNVDEVREEVSLAIKACARRLKVHLVKKKRREQSSEKFTIVREVLPMMAEMSAKVLGRPIPDISKSLTKIMNIVLVDDKVEFKQGKHEVSVDVYNYTPKRQKLTVQVVLPDAGKKEFASGPPAKEESGHAEFEIDIRPVESKQVRILLSGLKKDDYARNEIYVSGIDPACLVGAEPPSGELDIESLEMIESEKEDDETGPQASNAVADPENGAKACDKYRGGDDDE